MFSKTRAVVRNFGAKLSAAALTGFVSVSVLAQGTDPFDAAVATATGKVESYAGALVTLAAVAVVFMIGMKYVKRIPRAA